jgi:hypothetical protein
MNESLAIRTYAPIDSTDSRHTDERLFVVVHVFSLRSIVYLLERVPVDKVDDSGTSRVRCGGGTVATTTRRGDPQPAVSA